MPKLVLPGANVGFDAPPPSIAGLSRELWEYLWVLHQVAFGSAQSDGVLGTGSTTGDQLSHSDLQNLDADDHAQYLTTERHAAITGNPHGLTPEEFGALQPLWNAAALQGSDIATTMPADGQVLTYDETTETWGPADPANDPRTFLELSVSQLTVSPTPGPSAGLLLLPSQALILGVQVKNLTAIAGITGYQIGTVYRRDTWGANGPALAATTDLGGFKIANPIYTGVNVGTLMFTAQGGNFPSGVNLAVRIYFWRPPAW